MKNNDKQKTKQIIAILHIILRQNYFEYQDTIYHSKKCNNRITQETNPTEPQLKTKQHKINIEVKQWFI